MANPFIIQPNKRPFGKTQVISARLPDSVVGRLEEVAIKTGRSRNEIMLLCIEYALENLEIAGGDPTNKETWTEKEK